MAESSLSLGLPDLLSVVGRFLGYGGTSGNWSEARAAEIDRVVQSGYRQFLYPPAVEGVTAGYEWTFLRPATTIDTVADTAEQDLPDDFGRLINGFAFEAGTGLAPVLADVGEGRIRESRQQFDEIARPRIAAILAKTSDGTTGQRRQVMWYPTPDTEYTLSYRYESYAGELTAAAPYPLGGMKHAELVRESCLAAAEVHADDTKGVHWDAFTRSLIASIARDRREGAKFYGQVGCKNEYGDNESVDVDYSLIVSGTVIQ